MKLKVQLGLLVILAVVAVLGRPIWKHIPPFERGVHDLHGGAGGGAGGADGPRIGACPVFPADSVWNTPIDKLPVDALSAAYVASIGNAKVHPDFGSDLTSGIPYTLIAAQTKRVPITFTYREDSDLSNYPIPPNAPVEGGVAATGDRHILLVDAEGCVLWEVFAAYPLPDGSWRAGSGIRMDLASNALRGAGKTSADAAGLPIFPGLVRYEEVQAGAIRHALRFTVPRTRNAYIWPGKHKASRSNDPSLPPMGARLRLRATFDVSPFSRSNQVILEAMKKYGMFLADNGGAIFVSGVSDKRWDDGDLHKLGAVRASDFEVVDESGLQVQPDSGQVNPVATRR